MAILIGGSSSAGIEQVSSFPAGASEGTVVYHTSLQALFVNVDDTGDTTDVSAWEISSNKTIITEVSATNTTTCDSISNTVYRTAKWVISFTETTGGKFAATEVLANHNGTNVIFNEYSMMGDAIDYEIDVELSGGSILLTVKNNEAKTLTVSVLRFSLI